VRLPRTLPSETSPPCRPACPERFIRNRPVTDRTTKTRFDNAAPCEASSPKPGPSRSARAHRAGFPALPPDAPPSGEGTDTRIERRAPEGVEVVPEALLSSSATTASFEAGALPGFQAAVRAEPLSSTRRVPKEPSQNGWPRSIIIGK
jgi:hypothetical protein